MGGQAGGAHPPTLGGLGAPGFLGREVTVKVSGHSHRAGRTGRRAGARATSASGPPVLLAPFALSQASSMLGPDLPPWTSGCGEGMYPSRPRESGPRGRLRSSRSAGALAPGRSESRMALHAAGSPRAERAPSSAGSSQALPLPPGPSPLVFPSLPRAWPLSASSVEMAQRTGRGGGQRPSCIHHAGRRMVSAGGQLLGAGVGTLT